MERWEADRAAMHAVDGRLPYPYMDDEQRKVARDAHVSWKGSRYSVPCVLHESRVPATAGVVLRRIWQHFP